MSHEHENEEPMTTRVMDETMCRLMSTEETTCGLTSTEETTRGLAGTEETTRGLAGTEETTLVRNGRRRGGKIEWGGSSCGISSEYSLRHYPPHQWSDMETTSGPRARRGAWFA